MVGTVHPPEEIGVNRPYLIRVHSWLKTKVGKIFENFVPQIPEKEMRPRMETNTPEELGEPRMSRIAQIRHSTIGFLIPVHRGRLPLPKKGKNNY